MHELTMASRRTRASHDFVQDGGSSSPEQRRDDAASSSSKGKGPSRTAGASSSRRSAEKNLTHDTIRSKKRRRRVAVAGAAETEEEEKQPAPRDVEEEPTFGGPLVSDALRGRLSELGLGAASAPWFVCRKELTATDAKVDQNRLQISCGSGGGAPITRLLTDAENAAARTNGGLPVTSLDRRGRAYATVCRLFCGGRKRPYYRFRGPGWQAFLRDNGLLIPRDARSLPRPATVELWAFRSHGLPKPKAQDEDGVELVLGHPDGALGLVVLLRDDDGGEQQVEVEEPLPPASAAPAREEISMSKLLLLVGAAALLLLRRSDGTNRKGDDDGRQDS